MCGVPYLLIVGTADRTAPRWWRRTVPGSDKGATPSLERLQQSKHHHTFYLLHDGQVVHTYILSLQNFQFPCDRLPREISTNWYHNCLSKCTSHVVSATHIYISHLMYPPPPDLDAAGELQTKSWNQLTWRVPSAHDNAAWIRIVAHQVDDLFQLIHTLTRVVCVHVLVLCTAVAPLKPIHWAKVTWKA